MKRKIVQIDAEKCDGCGLCARACHERAIEIVAGKAKLISDTYCDGLGDCLPACPRGAIQIMEREALAYDEAAVQRRQQEQAGEHGTGCRNGGACPGSAARRLSGGSCPHTEAAPVSPAAGGQSELRQWPVQLALANPRAEYFQGADLLFAADCAAYAYANLHRDFMAGHVTLIGCPKLDGAGGQAAKIAEILSQNDIRSITVVRMEVPCCGGLVGAVKAAMLQSQTIVPYREVILGIDGTVRGE